MAEVNTCIITFNQEKYVAQAIESALNQKTEFAQEIIICDDCSTDNTQQIIQSYTEKFPQRIKAYFNEKNLGMLKNWERALTLCNGKYIALLEGDDYWIDENKLQKQFQILEQNKSCSVVFTNAIIQYENKSKPDEKYAGTDKPILTTRDLIKNNYLPTCTVFMRNNIGNGFFHPAYFESPFADWIINILNSQLGDIYFLNEVTATYRFHGSGVWSSLNEEKKRKNLVKIFTCIEKIIADKELNILVKKQKRQKLSELVLFYRQQKMIAHYLFYRTKLLFQ